MESFYKFFITVQSTLPIWLTALIAGLLMSWLVVQSVKFGFPLSWDPERRKQGAQLIAFLSAFWTVIWVMGIREGVIVALIAGLGSPVIYYLFFLLIRRWFPWLADLFSADVRGVILGDKRENRSE